MGVLSMSRVNCASGMHVSAVTSACSSFHLLLTQIKVECVHSVQCVYV